MDFLFTRVSFGHSVGGGYFSRLIPVDDVDIKFVLHANDSLLFLIIQMFLYLFWKEMLNVQTDLWTMQLIGLILSCKKKNLLETPKKI